MNASNDKSVMANSLGEFLQRERELRHISLNEVAERTKISRRYLEAIEEERYDRLPGETFVRGFIRSYAQSVGLDPEDTLLMYSQSRAVHDPPTLRPERPAFTRHFWNERSLLGLLIVAVMVVGVVLLGIVGFSAGPHLFRFTASSRVDVAKAPTSGLPLVLTATADSDTWIRVAMDDQEVQDMLLGAGQSAKWMAQERFILSIGNAQATRLRLNGRELTLPRPAQSILLHYTVSRDMLP